MAPPTRHRCLVVCAPGVEALTTAEVAGLGGRVGRTLRGGVEVALTTRQLYLANAWLRTATRVLVRLGSFEASTFAQLEQRVAALGWDPHLPAGVAPRLRVTSVASELFHTGAIEERVLGVLGHPAGGAPDEGDDRPLVVVRVDHDRVTVSVDSSGAPLYKRGWRQAVAKAPLRETLAAACLLAVGWDGTTALVDPFCGSGTLPIEAALLATGTAPGRDRPFAFQAWPSFEPGTWASVRGGLRAPGALGPGGAQGAGTDQTASDGRATGDGSGNGGGAAGGVAIVGSDRDAGAVGAATANAERAGVGHLVGIAHAAVSAVEPPPGPPGWVVANPPYGERVGGADLRDLYDRLGHVLRTRFTGWSVALLVADARLAGRTGVPLEARLRLSNGGIPVELLASPAPLG